MSSPRLFVASPPVSRRRIVLPASAARHVQVLRLPPGAPLVLFDGGGCEWPAQVTRITRSEVEVEPAEPRRVDREIGIDVTIAIGMPANDRMDYVVEKATELGAAGLQPLVCERSVLRLAGERAAKKVAHWQGVAVAACEQCGRNRLPRIEAVRSLPEWLGGLPPAAEGEARWLLSPGAAPPPPAPRAATLLSGPEGGLAPDEEAIARSRGFVPVGLGPRVLRADTAPLALLAHLALAALHP